MSERLRESVSALVDGEVQEFELRKLLASDDFGSVRKAWQEYQVLGGSLTGVDRRLAGLDISARVMTALDAEETLQNTAREPARWWRPVASVAVAASMAAVVVVGVRGFGGGEPEPQIAVVEPVVSGKVFPATSNARVVGGNVTVGAQLIGQGGVRAVSLSPDEIAREQLDRYMLRHTERAALSNGQGLINFARVDKLEAE